MLFETCCFCGNQTILPAETVRWHCYCTKCGATGPIAETRAEAIEKWNHRVKEQPVAKPSPVPCLGMGYKAVK